MHLTFLVRVATGLAAARVLALLLLPLAASAQPAPAYAGPFHAGETAEPQNNEASGLAASRRTPGLLWTHNDSGGEPVLFALAADGSLRGKARLIDQVNRDWEDIAAFELDGRAWLLVADTGDNTASHAGYSLHVVAEPDPATLSPDRELIVQAAYSIHFIYPDGPRDCEAVAADPHERAVYLLSKRNRPARLYRLPLAASSASKPAVAEFLGSVPHLPRPGFWDRFVPAPAVAYAGQPTAMDFLPDGSAALVLTYGGLFYFPRDPGESWAAALGRKPVPLPPFSLFQAEGACFTPDGRSIYLVSETTHALLRYDRRD